MISESILTKYSLTDKTSFFTLNLKGARKCLTLSGIPLLIETTRSDGKIGSTHPCTPNFANKVNQFSLPQHGPARDSVWTMMEETPNSITVQFEIEGGTYPTGLVVTQKVSILEKNFVIETVHENKGTMDMPVIYGEHFYWSIPQTVQGMTVNGQNIEKFKGFQERFNSSGVIISLNSKNEIHIPQLPLIILEQQNLPTGVLWRSTGDTAYICLEPVSMNPEVNKNGEQSFGSAESLIKVGESTRSRISIELLNESF